MSAFWTQRALSSLVADNPLPLFLDLFLPLLFTHRSGVRSPHIPSMLIIRYMYPIDSPPLSHGYWLGMAFR